MSEISPWGNCSKSDWLTSVNEWIFDIVSRHVHAHAGCVQFGDLCRRCWSVVPGMIPENAQASTNERLHVQAHMGMPLWHLSTPVGLFSHDDSHLPCRNVNFLMEVKRKTSLSVWDGHVRTATASHAEQIATFRPKQASPWSRSSHTFYWRMARLESRCV